MTVDDLIKELLKEPLRNKVQFEVDMEEDGDGWTEERGIHGVYHFQGDHTLLW